MTPHDPGFVTIPVSAAETSPAMWVPPATVLPLLEQVERLPEDASGALLVGEAGEEVGSILVDRGRICWAASGEMASRLTSLLCQQAEPPISTKALEGLYRECRETKTPVLRFLVQRGVVKPDILKRVLRQHCAEAIALLSSASGGALPPVRWEPRPERPFDAEHSFTPLQILTTIGALFSPDCAQRARSWLRMAVSDADCGVIFMQAQEGLFPIGIQGRDPLRIVNVLELGSWAHGTLDVAAGLAGNVPLVSGAAGGGATVITWKRSEVVYLVFPGDSRSYARLVSRLCRELAME